MSKQEHYSEPNKEKQTTISEVLILKTTDRQSSNSNFGSKYFYCKHLQKICRPTTVFYFHIILSCGFHQASKNICHIHLRNSYGQYTL